jgi:apolipoprotein N-acyltransferase
VTDLLAGARSGAGVPRKTAIGLVVVFTAVGIFGAIRLSQDLEPASAPRLRVAVVQGNLDEKVRIRGAAGQAWVLQRMLEQSREAVAEGARLVVWPEGTLPEPVRPDATALHPLLGSFAALDAELLIGGITREATGSEVKLTNSAFLTDGSLNVKARYDKRHLVPFGEYVPLASILPVHWFVPQGVAFFSPGKDHAPLSAASGKLGVMICYESIFPEIAREAAALGAQLLVVITNDSWYGFTSAPHQHLAIARLRAIETGRNLVRAANCGLSAVIDSRGRVLEVLPLGLVPTAAETPGVQDLLPPARLTATVALHDGKTVYGTIGESFALACAAASVALLLLTFTRFRRRPGSEPPIPSAGN